MIKKIEKNIFGLLLNGGIHNIITIYTGTFLVAHILNVSDGNFFNVALYYTISYLVLLVCYSLCSLIIPKFNKVHIVRVGIFFHCISLAIMAILQERLTDYLVPIAIFYSIGNAIYYSALNSLSNESVKGKKITNYNTYSLIVSNVTSIVVPIIFGRVIDTSSLYVISVFALILGILQICSTFLFDKPNLTHNKLDLKGYYNECYNSHHKKTFQIFFTGYFFYGCKDAIGTLVTMLIVLTFKTNTSLGMISSLIACLTILVLIFVNRKYHSKYAYWLLLVTGITAISILCLVININKVAIIFFNICYSAVLAIITRSFTIKRSGLIRAINKKQYIIEHQAVSEMFLNLGRTSFYLIILFASFTSEIWIYKALLMIGLTVVCLYGVFSYVLEKEYEKILIEREFKKQRITNNEEIHELIPSYSNPNNETILR